MNLTELLKSILNEDGITEEQLIAKLKEHDAFKDEKPDLSGLLNKRDELLAKNKELKDKLTKLEEQQTENKKQTAENKGDIDALKAMHQAKIDELNQIIKAKDGELFKIKIDGGVTEALTKAGVKPELFDGAKALIMSGIMGEARIVEGIAMLGEKLLPNAIDEWAGSDTGSHFIAAKATSGGGANASQGSHDTGKNPYSKEYFSLTEQYKLEKENPQLAKQYQESATT